MYRFTAFVLCCTFLFGGSSCKKDELQPGFEMPYQFEFNIPPGINVFETHFFNVLNVPTRYNTLLDQNNVTDATISAIVTQQAQLAGVFGDENFNFIEEVSLRVFDERLPNDYLEIAYRFPTPLEPGNRLDLIPSLADAKPFFVSPRVGFSVVIRLRTTTIIETPVRVNLIMRAQYL